MFLSEARQVVVELPVAATAPAERMGSACPDNTVNVQVNAKHTGKPSSLKERPLSEGGLAWKSPGH